MPETPDFDQIALRIVETLLERAGQDLVRPDPKSKARAQIDVAEQLRLMWNSRGAADLAKIDAVLAPTAAAPYVKTINHAIRGLDR